MKQIVCIILMLFATCINVNAKDSEGIKIKNGKCSVDDVIKMISSYRLPNTDYCGHLPSPSIELDDCLKKLGDGDWENGVSEAKKRVGFNVWASKAPLILKPKNIKKKYPCDAVVEVSNEILDEANKNSRDRNWSRKIIIKNNKLMLE